MQKSRMDVWMQVHYSLTQMSCKSSTLTSKISSLNINDIDFDLMQTYTYYTYTHTHTLIHTHSYPLFSQTKSVCHVYSNAASLYFQNFEWQHLLSVGFMQTIPGIKSNRYSNSTTMTLYSLQQEIIKMFRVPVGKANNT